ncbi:MAG TPA: imidazole glycerol phosphate synthase subunit HisH, partial [Acidimicrobiales bacterium]|nr:imidazole glycerol phosphate synthase subunit HisH [Acidimicrobiales bacterium]
MIAVLDYGIGNLRSAEKALQHVGAEARLVTEPSEAMAASGVVLPGVGAFGACASALRRSGLDAAVHRAIAEGVPFLGICVGFQLMFESSEEDPQATGLGVWQGRVCALAATERRPQMQWNVVHRRPSAESRLLTAESQWYYFVHSYAPVPAGEAASGVVGTCDYGGEVVAALERGVVFGAQFHP